MDSNEMSKWAKHFQDEMIAGLSPYTEDSTRKQGRELLIFSLVTILMSYGIISQDRTMFLGISLGASRLIVPLEGLICLYLSFTYWIGWVTDRDKYELRSEIREKVENFQKTKFSDEYWDKMKEYAEKNKNYSNELESLNIERIRKAKEIEEKIKNLDEPIEEDFMTAISYWNALEKYWDLKDAIDKEINPIDERISRLSDLRFDAVIEQLRYQTWTSISSRYQNGVSKSQRVRFYLELVVPFIFGLGAIISVLIFIVRMV